jgi:hypothetical protein
MKLNVLFIGNSHTYLHYMPQMLVGLVKAEDRGFDLAVDQSVGEGAGLEWHWNHEPTRQMMRSRKWDFIVLQDRSGGPLEDPDSFQKHARLLDSEIKKLGADTIFYLTWANRDHPASQTRLTEAYRRIAQELDAILAPVGIAWQNAKNFNPGIDLHHKDGRHASPVGAYLTACVFYSVLSGKSPAELPESFFIEGKNRPDQGPDQSLLLQKMAWEAGIGNSECGSRKNED